jgi:hypothetical protein
MDAVMTETRTVTVEFLGLFSPYAHPDVQKMLAAPARSPEARREKALVRQELTKQEQKRQMQGFARVQGRTRLTLGPHHGLSRSYTWGPKVWTVEMEPHDVEILMQLHPAHRQAFRVIDDDVIVVRM